MGVGHRDLEGRRHHRVDHRSEERLHHRIAGAETPFTGEVVDPMSPGAGRGFRFVATDLVKHRHRLGIRPDRDAPKSKVGPFILVVEQLVGMVGGELWIAPVDQPWIGLGESKGGDADKGLGRGGIARLRCLR